MALSGVGVRMTRTWRRGRGREGKLQQSGVRKAETVEMRGSLYCRPLGATVTAQGRRAIATIKEHVEQNVPNSLIVGGDTDSVFTLLRGMYGSLELYISAQPCTILTIAQACDPIPNTFRTPTIYVDDAEKWNATMGRMRVYLRPLTDQSHWSVPTRNADVVCKYRLDEYTFGRRFDSCTPFTLKDPERSRGVWSCA